MEKEISSGAMLGIVLIALAAIIGIGFGIFAIAKGTANEGTTDVQDSLSSVSDSYFEDFNQKTITGSNLKSCVTKLDGKSYALLLNTQSMNAGQTTSNPHKSIVLFKGQDTGDKTVGWVNLNALFSVTGDAVAGTASAAGKALKTNASSGTAWTGTSTGGSNAPADSMDTLDGTTHLAFENGTYYTNYTFHTIAGNVQYDTNTASLNTSGDCLMIDTNSKFKANLIKDTSGKIVGIVFEQIAKKN